MFIYSFLFLLNLIYVWLQILDYVRVLFLLKINIMFIVYTKIIIISITVLSQCSMANQYSLFNRNKKCCKYHFISKTIYKLKLKLKQRLGTIIYFIISAKKEEEKTNNSIDSNSHLLLCVFPLKRSQSKFERIQKNWLQTFSNLLYFFLFLAGSWHMGHVFCCCFIALH